jgi:hypothetical protein
MSSFATITWNYVPGSLSTLVEYREQGDTDWITPTSPNNPTVFNTYTLEIEDNVIYDVRLTTNGIACGPRSMTLTVFTTGNSCCPSGYTLSEDGTFCFQLNTTTATPPVSPENTVAKSNISYGPYGTLIYNPGYDINGTGGFVQISYSNTFWANGPGYPTFPGPGTSLGPINRAGIWSTTTADGQVIGFSACIEAPVTGTYYVGIAGDNIPRITLDGNIVVQMDPSAMGIYLAANGYPDLGGVEIESTFRFFHVYPVVLEAGTRVLEMICENTTGPAAMAAEIYNLSSSQIQAASSYGAMGSGLVFSTKDFVGEPVQVGNGGIGYTCPPGYSLVLCDGPAYCTQTLTTATIPCTTTTTTTTTTSTTTTTTTTL